MAKKGVRIIKNGEPSRFLTGDDVLVTNVSSHTGETVDEALSSVADTLDDHQKEIDKLKSNVKYIYTYGGVGGKGSGGSGGGSGSESAVLFASLADHQMIADSVNAIVLPGPGQYPIDISIGKSGGQTYYVKTDTENNFNFAKTEALSIEKNGCRYQKMVTLNENGTIIVQFYDPDGFPLQRIEQKYIVNPHKFDMKFMYVFNNQEIEFNSKNEYFIGDRTYNDPFIDLSFKIDLTGVTNISIEYSIGDTDVIENDDEYMSGQGVKNDFTSTDISNKNDHFRIPLNKLKRKGVKFTDESNTGTYTVTATLNYMVNGVPIDPDVRTFKIVLIPGYLYINVRNPQDLLYDTPQEILDAKAAGVGGVPEKSLSVGAYTSFYCKVFEGPMRTTAKPYVIYLSIYNCSIVDGQLVPDANPIGDPEEMSANEQQEMSIPFSVAFGTTGIKKLSFTTNGRKDDIPDTGVPVEKYIYINEATSEISWYPTRKDDQGEEIEIIRHNNYYFRANSGEEKTYSKNIFTGEQSFPTLPSGYGPLELSVTDEPVTISMPEWEPDNGQDTTILSFGMQYSAVNDDDALILETFDHNSNTADIQLHSKTLFDKDTKKICIPPENNFNKSINSQYHLVQIVRTRIGYVNVTTPKYATYLYIDGRLESNDPSGENYGQLFVGKIVLNNVNVVYNLINLQFVLMDETTNYTVDGLVYQYYLAYKEIMQQSSISSAEMVVFSNLQNIKFDGVNTIVDFSTVKNIAPQMPIPTIMMEATELPENLATFKEYLFKGYANGKSLFSRKEINLWWCNPEKDDSLNKIEVQNIRDRQNQLYDGIWEVELQGTSTMRNRIKNFSLMVTTSNSSDPNKEILMSPNYEPNNGKTFLPEKVWTLKADIADSAHANNTAVGKFVNRVCTPFSNNLNLSTDVSKYIKNTLEGFPVLMFFKIGEEVYYFGIYNFNMGRDSYYNLGYHTNEDTLEMISNIPEMQSSSLTFSIGSNAIISDLAIGEVQENHAEFDFHQFHQSVLFTPEDTERDTMFGADSKIKGGGNAKTTLANFVEMVARAGGYCFSKIGKIPMSSKDENGDCAIRYEIDEYTDENGNIKYHEYVPDIAYQFRYDGRNKIWNEVPDPELDFNVLGLDVNNNLLKCISNYDDEGIQHDDWNYLDFTSASEYYTICMAFGLVDSILKNMNIKSWDNKKCFIAFYDMDCAFGEDNAGHEDVSYLAATDYWRSPIRNNYVDRVEISYDYWDNQVGKGFDYPSSYLFAIAKYAQPILKLLGITTVSLNNYPQQFWANMRKRGGQLASADDFMRNYFSSGVNVIPAYLTSLNYQVKYLYYGKKLDKNGEELEEMEFLANQSAFNGTRIEKVKEWLTKRLHFLDIVFNVQNIDIAIGGGCNMPKPDSDTYQELTLNPDVTILSDAFTSENGNAALINGQSTPVFVRAPKNTPVIIVRGGFNDIYLLPEGTNRIKANAVAKETYIIRGSKEFTYLSMVDPFLTTGYKIESDNLELVNYGGMTFGPISSNLEITSTSVKEINLQIETWIGNLQITNSGLNGHALHTLNVSKSGFTGTWTGLSNLKYLNISSVTNNKGKIAVSQCPLLRGENCVISGTEEKPTTLDILELMNVSGTFNITNTSIREMTIVATLGSDAEFTITGDTRLRSLTLQNFKKVTIKGCPNLDTLSIIEPPNNEDHSKDVCESIIIEIPEYNPTSGERYYLKKFNSDKEGVFDFTGYTKLNKLGLSGVEYAEVIKIPNRSVAIETFKNNKNLEFIDTAGQNSIIELTKEATFENCPCYGMRQSWWGTNGQDITTLTGDPATPSQNKLTKMKVSEDCTSLASTFYKLDSSKVSKYINTTYTNFWGQKVYNKSINMADAKKFINDYVGGGIIDDAYIGDDNIIVDSITQGRQYGENRMANIESLNSCFYKQRDIFYDGASNDSSLPNLSGYENLTDIAGMYYGTQISYISAGLLSLYDGRNNNDSQNQLRWAEFTGNRDLKIAKDAFKHISYRISNLSQMNLTIYDPANYQTMLNTDPSAPDETRYLNIVDILCPQLDEHDDYIPFTRLKSFNSFTVNSQQFIDYTTLFDVCPEVEELNGFLKGDLRRSKIDGMLYNCTKLTRISDSISHTGSIDDLGYMINLFDFFNWTANTSYGIRELFSSNSNSSEPSFAVKKIISQEDFTTIMSVLHNYQNLEQLSNIFSYCYIDNYDPSYEIKLSGDMTRVTNINSLFYRCRSLTDNVPLKIRRSLFKHLPNVTLAENTFNGVWFDHMPSYDFFCKRNLNPSPVDVYVSNTDEAPAELNTPTNAKLYTVQYNQTINSLYNCFSGAKFYGCKCWFDVDDYFENVEDSNVTLTPYDDYLKYTNGDDCNHTIYFKKENGVWNRYTLSHTKAYTDTLDNYTHYVPYVNSAIGEWQIDNHDIDRDLSTFNNKRNGYPYDTNLIDVIHLSPTFCCLPPDIFYGCNYRCDLRNVFEDTNIIGVLPKHLIENCYDGKLNNMLKNVNVLPNLMYHYDSKTQNDGNYLSMIEDIPIDESMVNHPNSDTDTIRYNLDGSATVLFRNDNGELRRRRPIVSAHLEGSEELLTEYTIPDYSKSIFTYVPQGYANNQNLDDAFTFRYNLPNQVDMSRQYLYNNYGIVWPGDTGGINEAPDVRPDLWPYYTQYFFTVDESIVWNKVAYMNHPFITETQDIDWADIDEYRRSGFYPQRVFSNASKTYSNKWWPTDYTIEKTAWDNKTAGIMNIFLNLCGQRDVRTSKIVDCGCLIGKALRNVPKLNSFISGSLVAFLNGKVFDSEVDAGEFTDLNGSSQAIQYTLGMARNIIFPVYHMASSNLDLASRFILSWSGVERTVFYSFMFPTDSLQDYISIFGVDSCMLSTPKYRIYNG